MAKLIKEKNPSEKVDVNSILKQLNLTEIEIVDEEFTTRPKMQASGISAGSVGFMSSIIPETNSYALMFDQPFNVGRVPFGKTKVLYTSDLIN